MILAAYWPSQEYFVDLFENGSRATDSNQLQQVLTARLRETLATIIASGAIPVLVKDNAPAAAGPKCPITRALFNSSLTCTLPRTQATQRHGFLDSVLGTLVAEFPQLRLIDPKDAMCDAQVCHAMIDGIPLYLDDNHLNDAGSRTLGRAYLRQHANPFKTAEP